MSGDTDFNFGAGWSHSIYAKFEKYLGNTPQDYTTLYKRQLEKCEYISKSILNVSLMPQTGNLQAAKKGIGNDRLDTFIWHWMVTLMEKLLCYLTIPLFKTHHI